MTRAVDSVLLAPQPCPRGFGCLYNIYFSMSKGNMLLGHARGKVGDLVFSRSNGQQIVRARNSVVKNPKTTAQMIQRIKLYTVVSAYSAMKSIVDHSFQGVPVGQKSMSKFTQEALKVLTAKIAAVANYEDANAFAPLGTGYFAVNEWPLSTGTLPMIVPAFIFDDAAGEGYGKVNLSSNTYQAIIDAYGLKRGDQLTFISVSTIPGVANNQFDFARVILDPRDANGNELALSTAFVGASNAITSPNPRNEGAFNLIRFSNDSIQFAVANKAYLVGVAVIVSRKGNDGEWLRSKANLVIDSEQENDYLLGDCLRYAAGSESVYASDYYLNNAGVSAITPAGNDGGGGSGGGGVVPPDDEGGEG